MLARSMPIRNCSLSNSLLAHGLWFFGVALATYVITRSLGFNLEFVCVIRTPRLPDVHTAYNRWIRETVRESSPKCPSYGRVRTQTIPTFSHFSVFLARGVQLLASNINSFHLSIAQWAQWTHIKCHSFWDDQTQTKIHGHFEEVCYLI